MKLFIYKISIVVIPEEEVTMEQEHVERVLGRLQVSFQPYSGDHPGVLVWCDMHVIQFYAL